jgi:hypothetical protein
MTGDETVFRERVSVGWSALRKLGWASLNSDEVQSRFGATLPIPSDCALNIYRALVVLNTLSAQSPLPTARDAVLPRGG